MHNSSLTLVVGGATSSIARSVMSEFANECTVVPLVRRKVAKDFFDKAFVDPIEIDYYSEASCKSLSELFERNSKIIFINFSVYSDDKIFLNQTIDNFIDTYKVNVLTNVYPLKALIPKMVTAKWGRIIFIASTRGIRGDVGISSYSASKSALLGLSGTLSREYGKFGITSNVLSLGYFDSKLLKQVPENKLKALMSGIPGRKIGTGNDIAAAIRMLIDSNYINGSVVQIDGGG